MDRVTKKVPKRKCRICGKMFHASLISSGNGFSKATLCSKKCRLKSRLHQPKWTEGEIAYLKEHANDLPFVLFYAQFCREQKIHGWPPRTKRAFRHKMHELQISAKSIYVVVNKTTLARMLGLDARSVSRMIRDGLKISHRCPKKGTIHIAFREVKRFAAQNPERFGGLDYYKLLSVLDDDEFCREILEKYPQRHPHATKPRRVLCLTTSRCFKSINEAAKVSFISQRSVTRSILEKRPVHGLTFKFYP